MLLEIFLSFLLSEGIDRLLNRNLLRFDDGSIFGLDMVLKFINLSTMSRPKIEPSSNLRRFLLRRRSIPSLRRKDRNISRSICPNTPF